MYKLHNDLNGNVSCIEKIGHNTLIPFDNANTDYKEYLEWVAEGNTPEEAE